MSRPFAVCAPMAMEAARLRAGLRADLAASVVRTGMGPARSLRAAGTEQLREAHGVLVAGIAGGLRADLVPGEIVVADEVRRVGAPPGGGSLPPERVRCGSAPMLAATLRAAGLPVRVGAVVSTGRVVTDADRAALAESGALAVDMESAWLLPVDGRPAAVIRVVADTANAPLLRPATVGRVRSALRRLTEVGPAVEEWFDALAERTVLLAAPRSFCAGVDRAVEVVERALDMRPGPVYVRKQIVHNAHVVHDLEDRGAVFVEELDEVPDVATVVFSAHGVAPVVRQEAKRRELSVIDATCPLVSKVHSEVRRFGDQGDTVVFIGHAGHEETVGTMGERPERTVLVETVEDARAVVVEDPERVSYLVQTTLAADEVVGIVDVLRERFPRLKAPPSDDICYATTNRQQALRAIAAESDVILVVGSVNSSNSRRLVETAERMGTPAHLVDDAGEVRLAWLKGARTVGVTAGASAPEALADEVVDALRGLGPVDVQERRITTENVRFATPKEVRSA